MLQERRNERRNHSVLYTGLACDAHIAKKRAAHKNKSGQKQSLNSTAPVLLALQHSDAGRRFPRRKRPLPMRQSSDGKAKEMIAYGLP